MLTDNNLSDSKENLIYLNTVRSKVIYIVVLVFLTLVIVSLPVIKIPLSVQGRGIIRPKTEKTEIKAIRPELVTSVYIAEGQPVQKGDTLITLRQDILQSKLTFYLQELARQQAFVADLKMLAKQNGKQPSTSVYTGQYNSYQQKLGEIEGKIVRSKAEVDRNRSLFEKEIISQKDFNDLRFNLDQLQKAKNILVSDKVAQWKTDLEKYTTNVNDLNKQIEGLEQEKKFYIITAPVSGTIEEFSGIYAGSMLQSGQTIAVISPESEKIAEVYVSAKDIGYLSKGQTTKIQVDAFDYNQWGALQGEIINISDDFILIGDDPVFNVKCKLDKDYLELKSGVKGRLKKGMTVNARFMVARRSLFQLLYQKTDNWLNPARYKATG
jgi:membrane fusion protein, peptide pheromone/bacteriocin exporter